MKVLKSILLEISNRLIGADEKKSTVMLDSKPDDIKNHEEYLKLFEHLKDEKKLELLRTVLDTRKFEIEMYWKRSTYYWTLIGAIFVAYFAIKDGQHKVLPIILSSLGFLFSVGWYCVGRGSKFWQINWEKHIEMLETSLIGPIFKTTISYSHYTSWKQFKNLFGPYAFSVTKVNSILSFFAVGFWLVLMISNISFIRNAIFFKILYQYLEIIIPLFAFVGAWATIRFGRSGKLIKGRPEATAVNFQKTNITSDNS